MHGQLTAKGTNQSHRGQILGVVAIVATLVVGLILVQGAAAPRSASAAPRVAPRVLMPGEIITMDVPGINGDHTRGTGTIEVDSFTWGALFTGPTGSGAGHPSGKTENLVVLRQVDKASPLFFKDCITGLMFKAVTVYVEPGGTGGDAMTIKLGVAHIISTHWVVGSSPPQETVTFGFRTESITYSVRPLT